MTMTVTVPGCSEPSSCQVEVWAARDGRPAVVVLSELPDKPGLSVSTAFPFLAQEVRSLLLLGSLEPIWVERWPARAVAGVVLERPGETTDTIVFGPPTGRTRTPLPPGELDRYLNGLPL